MCCADPASYVILPTTDDLTHDSIVERIQML